MTTAYVPREGSAAWKVIQYLRANPDERLDADVISARCDCGRASVHTLMGPSVEAKLLKRQEDLESGELVYSLGPARTELAKLAPERKSSFHGWLERKGLQSQEGLPTRSAATPATGAPAATRRSPAAPFVVDLATIKVEKSVPLPSRRATMDWTPLLDQLEVGDSFALPAAARSSITGAIKAYKDATQRELTSRTLGDEIRVWRTK
ncbi:hypothetical protein [Paracidovorax cattleyae]|uniref:hypothetical protein n=1 Tax=Paracidovorax cattleyae TaxID=80868 RepID=UPI0018AFA1F6|nr:hypothetical protein [Paracidovorax cattleyae]MBF9263596.1 hypothetical protein [Paracidovorax cattleyae]